ncbi:oligopeptide:H+ symporter [Streptomyces decoyicus]|uniref:oligopeptide:H+ symporter n=1 Tax=Streptomyces decoyicus TaxID=249567 RepID=UPI00363759CD
MVAVGCALGLTGTLTLSVGIGLISGVSVAVPVIYFVVMFASPRTERREKSALAAHDPLFLAAAVFYVIFHQFSSVLTLFAAERTDSSLFGRHFPSSWFFAVNPGAGLLIAPLLASVWTRMGSRQPATSLKFGAALLFVGASFLLIPVALAPTPGDRVAAPWLILVYLAQTVAELLLAPIGMAVTSRLAPRAFHGQTLAVWFCAPSMGAGLGAQLVGYYGEVSDLVYFGTTGAVAGGPGRVRPHPPVRRSGRRSRRQKADAGLRPGAGLHRRRRAAAPRTRRPGMVGAAPQGGRGPSDPDHRVPRRRPGGRPCPRGGLGEVEDMGLARSP